MPILFLLLLVLSWPAMAGPAGEAPGAGPGLLAELHFRAVGEQRSFPAEIVTEVMLDDTGFLWIGTREGLYLYDGAQFRKFQHEVQNPRSLSSNGIRGLLEDSRGRLWINTISGGLNLLDRSNWTFRSWRHDRGDPTSIIHDGVFALAEAPGGKLWVGTQAGLDLFDPSTGDFRHQVLATGGEFVMALLVDRDGRLWVATMGQGLFRQRADGHGFVSVPGPVGNRPMDVFALVQAADGSMWVGTRHGLYRVPAGDRRLQQTGLKADAAAGLANVTALQPTAAGGLWVGTFGVGLYWLAPGSNALDRVRFGTDRPGTHSIDAGAMALDRQGQLLLGTFGAGLFRASQGIPGLRVWQEENNEHAGLTYQDVYAVRALPGHQDDGGERLLVGTFGGGLNVIAVGSGKVEHWSLPVDEAMQRRLSGITDMLLTPSGVIWAVTNNGVYRWDRAHGKFHFYPPSGGTGPGGNPGYSYALYRDREGRIWVGSAGEGLFLYQPAGDSFRNFRPRRGEPHSLSDDFVTAMIEDRHGRLWVGTRSGGINICRFETTLRCRHLGTESGPHVISHDHVSSLLLAPDGAIWAGTQGGGLDRIQLDDRGKVVAVDFWTHDDGLGDDNVMALVYAPDGALWLSTHGGLSRFDPATGTFTNLTTADGLPTAIFNPKAAVLLGGKLYFGSAKGVVALDPGGAYGSASAPPTVIEAVLGLDGAHQPSRPAWQLDELQLPWRTPFSLQFAVLGYDGGRARYEYRLGADQAWIDIGNRGRLTLHALEPGEYVLQARGRRGGHGWTRTRPLALAIVPPWWRRSWVQAGAVVLLLLLLAAGFYGRVRELHARNRKLELAHDQREQALADARVSQGRLRDAVDLLRRTSMRLETAKEKERKYLARELHDEFGQALTTAKINLGLALAGKPADAGEDRVRDTIGLLQQMIGQVRSLSLSLRPPLLDERGLVPALEAYLHAVAERSELTVCSALDPAAALDSIEREIAVFRVVQEAVTNVLRHAHASRLEVHLTFVEDGIRIRVRDNGRGFDARAAGTPGEGGLGLFGMRERVYDLGGRWSADSKLGEGSVISAFIPARKPQGRSGDSDAGDSG